MNNKNNTRQLDWPLLAFGLIILLLVNVNQFQHWSQGVDYALYDKYTQASSQTANDKILIVEIDEQSLSLLGDWPWPRSYHAQMINILTQADAGVIAYNVVFSNANLKDENDQLLASAIEKSGRTILPLYFDRLLKEGNVTEVVPAKEFKQYAGLGHVNSYLDDDGTLRSIRLMDRFENHQWPHFAFASFLFNQPYSPLLELQLDDVYIPFVAVGEFERVSFVDVLTGLISPEQFSQRTVFVGMTATSMGDPLLTPMNDHGKQTPAVEINANVYQALDREQLIHALPSAFALLINSALILVSLYLMPRLSGIQQFIMTLLCLSLAWLLSYGLLQQGYWFRTAGLMIALFTIPFIWNLLRLSRLFNYFRRQIKQLKNQQAKEVFRLPNSYGLGSEHELTSLLQLMQIENYEILPLDFDRSSNNSINNISKFLELTVAGEERILLMNFTEFTELERHKLSLLNQLLLPKLQGFNANNGNSGIATDVFAQQLSLVNSFQHQLAMTHSLFEESIEGISAGILVSDLTGKVLFSNKALSELTQASIQDTKTLFEVVSLINDDWLAVLRDAVLYQNSVTTEAKSAARDLSVSIHCIQNKVDSNQSLLAPLLVFNITDISAVKQAHRSRSEMIDFLSHDLRSPMASLQALVNQARSSELLIEDANDLIEKVDLYSRRGLTFAEQFLELAKVEGEEEIDVYEVDLYSVSQNAFDTLYHQAQEKSIQLVMKADDDCWVMANGEMLERVVLNLVSNAIKYGSAQSQVLLTITRQKDSSLVVRVTDQGPGIPKELAVNLFQPYSRGTDSNTQKAQGIGLGLRFVDVALKRLGSEIQFDSSGNGASFYFKFESIEL